MYIEKLSGFREIVDGIAIEPQVYQPTPLGVEELCSYYTQKYPIDMQILEINSTNPHKEIARFEELKNSTELLEVNEGESRGIVLSQGQSHAVPVLLHKKNNKLQIFIFDSNSGPCITTYFNVANIFSEAEIFLNRGTRQADVISCITDAICILKDALRIENLSDLIQSKITEKPFNSLNLNSRLKIPSKPKPNNFFVFKMPEQLLKTAQRSAYLEQAEADMELIIQTQKGYSLKEFRERFCINVCLAGEDQKICQINSYLFFKSKKHKEILDQKNENLASVELN